jgi:hypothetical protein
MHAIAPSSLAQHHRSAPRSSATSDALPKLAHSQVLGGHVALNWNKKQPNKHNNKKCIWTTRRRWTGARSWSVLCTKSCSVRNAFGCHAASRPLLPRSDRSLGDHNAKSLLLSLQCHPLKLPPLPPSPKLLLLSPSSQWKTLPRRQIRRKQRCVKNLVCWSFVLSRLTLSPLLSLSNYKSTKKEKKPSRGSMEGMILNGMYGVIAVALSLRLLLKVPFCARLLTRSLSKTWNAHTYLIF